MHDIGISHCAQSAACRPVYATLQGISMNTHLIETSLHVSKKVASQPGAHLRRLLITAHHTLTIFGISAVALIALFVVRPDLAKHLSQSLLDQPAMVISAPPL